MPIQIQPDADAGELPPLARLEPALEQLLADHGAAGRELSVVIVGDARMSELHDQFLGIPETTDCLSFPLADGPDDPELGEVYVCVDVARREAAARGHAPEDELLLYAVHASLHLLGYDDKAPDARARMREAEQRYAGITGEG